MTATGLNPHREHCGYYNKDCTAKLVDAQEVVCVLGDDGSPICKITSGVEGLLLFNEVTYLDQNAILCPPCLQDSDWFGPLAKTEEPPFHRAGQCGSGG